MKITSQVLTLNLRTSGPGRAGHDRAGPGDVTRVGRPGSQRARARPLPERLGTAFRARRGAVHRRQAETKGNFHTEIRQNPTVQWKAMQNQHFSFEKGKEMAWKSANFTVQNTIFHRNLRSQAPTVRCPRSASSSPPRSHLRRRCTCPKRAPSTRPPSRYVMVMIVVCGSEFAGG